MARTRIKICGITRPEDAALAAELGTDAIGLNFVGGPRRIPLQQAFEIVRNLPPFLTIVALATLPPRQFPNALTPFQTNGLTPLQISEFHPRLPIQTFQMYGVGDEFEDPEYYSFYWAIVPVTDRDSIGKSVISVLSEYHDYPTALLLDTASPQKLGGTGQTFNWHWIAEAREAGELEGLPPIILAGGLNPDNVAEAIRIARPYAVDVSSGVEVAGKPGIKDPVKMRDFIQAVQGA